MSQVYYAECGYAECHYAECRGTNAFTVILMLHNATRSFVWI
jgi:hypothetical protein